MTIAQLWGEDTIYSEATCRHEDIYYEGSEDEQYESSNARRLRYEAAAQRYLDGETPLLLSAALRGPFEKEAGWLNPWRSQSRPEKTCKRSKTNKTSRKSSKRGPAPEVPETQLPHNQGNAECHLPSPESIKNASSEEHHPYLEERTVDLVQNWRSTVQQPTLEKDDFWAPERTPSHKVGSLKRRREDSSDWLRKGSCKRTRTKAPDSMEAVTPSHRPGRPQLDGPRASHDKRDTRATASASRTKKMARRESRKAGDGPPNTARSPSIKRTSPRGHTRKMEPVAEHSEDELALDRLAEQKAAATLSSPVSLKGGVQAEIQLEHQSPTKASTSSTGEASCSPASYDHEQSPGAFETQRDDSFIYKLGRRSIADRDPEATNSSPLSDRTSDKLTSLDASSELSSVRDGSNIMSPEPLPQFEEGQGEVLEEEMQDDTTIPDNTDQVEASESSSREKVSATLDIVDADIPSLPMDTIPSEVPEKQGQEATEAPSHMQTLVAENRPSPNETNGSQFSLRNMFQRFVPLGSWTRLSQPGSYPTETETMQVDEGFAIPSGTDTSQSVQRTEESEPASAVVPRSTSPKASKADETATVANETPTTSPKPNATLLEASATVCYEEGHEVTIDKATCDPLLQSPWSKSQESQALAATILNGVQNQQFDLEPLLTPYDETETAARARASPNTTSRASRPLEDKSDAHMDDTATDSKVSPAVERPTTKSPVTAQSTGSEQEWHKTTRPRTPEQRLPFKPFSAFMTPSPEHKARQKPRLEGHSANRTANNSILASVLKNPWSASRSARTNRRVSWAPLPQDETEATNCDGQSLPDEETVDEHTTFSTRVASPPPMAAVEDLPTSEDTDFHGHFNAIARRAADTPSKSVLGVEAQESGGNPATSEMLDLFLPANARDTHITVQEVEAEQTYADKGVDIDIKDVPDFDDMTDEVFRDMEEMLKPWNLEIEVDEAGREAANDQQCLYAF